MRANIANAKDISITQLEEVFATFNNVSADLSSSYRELEVQVSGLNEELATTQSARIKELTEKEQLAAKLSALMYALPGGVITLNAKGLIQEENPAAIQMLGKSFQGERWQQVLKNSISNGPILGEEVSFQNDKRVSISSSAYGDEGNTIILLTDVSENYRLNNVVSREKRLAALGEMAARLAHQVRTPLSSAILYMSHLSSSLTKESDATFITQKILARLCQIERLVDGMLSYIRGEKNISQKFSLNELLSDLKEASSLRVLKAKGELTLNCPDQEFIIEGDREALFNAISNSLENSIQAVKSKPKISISLVKEYGFYKISIADNGPGIDESIKEKVFDPFFSTRPMGTGLGLAVVLSAVESYKGEVLIKTPKSGGTILQLLIPDVTNNSLKIKDASNKPQQLHNNQLTGS